MPGIISQLPAGLLGMLGIQNFGETPKALADVVSPVIDLGDCYAANQAVLYGLATAANAGAGGFNAMTSVPAFATVPGGEVWRLLAFSCLGIANATGAVLQFAPAIQKDGTIVVLAPGIALAANETRFVASNIQFPLWLPAGTALGVYASTLTAGVTFSTQTLVARFKA